MGLYDLSCNAYYAIIIIYLYLLMYQSDTVVHYTMALPLLKYMYCIYSRNTSNQNIQKAENDTSNRKHHKILASGFCINKFQLGRVIDKLK